MADDCVEMSSPESTAAVNDSCLSPPRRSKITFHPDDTAARPACEACTVFDKDAIYERIELSDLRSTADAGCRSCHGEIEFYLQTNEEHEVPAFWGLLRVCSPIDRDPSSTATFAKIQRSLALCDSGHERCASEEGCLPTRVVDVGTSDGQGPCRLYETQRETGDYIALSHCWGRPELIFRTTKETLKSNQLELPWDKLSKTFQDAIHATRRIGKRYLWIDSLCIIQDSDDDWNKESAVMGDIYKNAYLTLGATASSDGAGGLFVERDCHILDIPIPESAPLKNVSLKARRCLLHRSLSAPPHGEPLSSRAWAWQERLLSRRIMHFSSEELIWECKSGTGCECAMQGELDDTKSTFHLVVDVPGWNTQLWRALLESYTQLELTYDKDRLPALSGIASQAFSKSDYLAGLGREFLLGDLCWVTNRRPHEPCRPISRNTGAPSWSWASVNGPVYWRSTIGWTPPKSLELVDASCTPEGENVYGRILHGHLVLRGVVVETNLRPLAESRVNYEAQWHYDRHIESPAGGGLKQGRFFLDCTAIDDTYLSTQPILLLILSYGISTLDVFALVLRRVEVDEVVYERIGVAEFRNVPGEYLDSMAPRVIKIF
ncbi:HET-domain-containing protein [Cadophora sp. DSE1049]|nr:HET-domain-containing protein [Cadophora sp. DSE1049]